MEHKKSEIISGFLNLIEDCKRKLPWAEECVNEQDKLTQDLLHKLELGDYKSRAKVATALSINRKDRRYYKDLVEEAVILVEFFKEYKDAVESLKQLLGVMRKVENYHKDRHYVPRVLKDSDAEK